MERRPRRRLSKATDSGKEKQPEDGVVGEVENSGQCSNSKSKNADAASSDSSTDTDFEATRDDVICSRRKHKDTSDLYSDTDSDYNDFRVRFVSDLSQKPSSRICARGSDDYTSDSFDDGNPSSKRGKLSSKKERRIPISKHEEVSDVGGEVELGGNDEYSQVRQQAVSPVFGEAKMKKNKRGRKKKVLLWHIWEAEQDRIIDEHMSENVDLDNQNDLMNETAEASSDLTMPLLRYQKEWLAWALKQESSANRGGILADEMGMGKTIQAIALVLAQRELQQRSCEPDQSIPSPLPCASRALHVVKGTLVICPVIAVTQWASEIDRFTSKGSTKVLIYHGPRRGRIVEFSDYDFVITTYSVVQSEYNKQMTPKVGCPYCGKLFLERRLNYHKNYYCGPDAVRTEKQSKQVKKNRREFIKGNIRDCDSNKMPKDWNEKLIMGFNNKNEEEKESMDRSLLHAVKWQRIILDEAHYIKSRNSKTVKAVLALESSYKWALSGTPLQNRVGELYTLIRFLQITPYSYYLCKDCDCKTLNHRSGGDCSNCNHKSVRHFCWWNKYIATPIHCFANTDIGERAMVLLKHKVLRNIVLRRTKLGRAADLALPPRIVSLRRDCLDVKENDYYTSLYTDCQAQFNFYEEANNLRHNYANVFHLLTRLRQAVDHPYLVIYSQAVASGSVMTSDATVKEICGICDEPVEDPVVTSCEHAFCKACLLDYSASLGIMSCPSCSKLLTVDLTSNNDAGVQTQKTIKGFRSSSILNRIQLENFQTSTKIEALREEIRFMIERDGSAKGIVFSQFTSFLDLICYSLLKSGVSCLLLDGSMSLAARNDAIKKFTDDPECKVFLMSLRAGGVALNMTVASHVFLMDPWWNPAVERQAQDRIHRIGQYKPIRIVRFVIENTIEERILKLQEKKELVFEGTLGGSCDVLGKLTEEDLCFLFS